MIPNKDELTRRVKLQRSVACIERELRLLSQKSVFLKQNTAQNDLPVVRRHELNLAEMLGTGSFSEVHDLWRIQLPPVADPIRQKARDALERTSMDSEGRGRYAIKHLRADLRVDESNFYRAAADLVMEAQFLANLDHPNIIKIRAWSGGVESFYEGSVGSFFLILDKLDETLLHRISQWRIVRKMQNDMYPLHLNGYKQQLVCAYQLASALEYLHQRRIIYRDLKPENVGFKDRQLVLLDFGLCRELPEPEDPYQTTFRMSGVGTRRYMAPEVFFHAEYNEKVDVYSWALLLYTMIVLQKPFNSYNSKMHGELVCKKGVRPYLYPHMPLGIQRLMQDCWAQKAKKRPSMPSVCARLNSLLQDSVQTPSPINPVGDLSSCSSNESDSQLLREPASSHPPTSQLMESFSRLFCGTTKIAKQASTLIRIAEKQMLETPPSFGRSRSIDHPELQHLRSAYL